MHRRHPPLRQQPLEAEGARGPGRDGRHPGVREGVAPARHRVCRSAKGPAQAAHQGRQRVGQQGPEQGTGKRYIIALKSYYYREVSMDRPGGIHFFETHNL